jgi:sulfatase modifying factor 1
MLFGCLVLFAMPVVVACPSMDFNGDCFVNLADFSMFASQWLTGNPGLELSDLTVFVEQWLKGNRLPEDMVILPAGIFQMGNSTNAGEGYSNELPVHTVTLDSFAVGKYEITNGQYCAFLNSLYPLQLKVVDKIVYAFSDADKSYPYCEISTYLSNSQIAFSNNTFIARTKSGRSMANDPMVQVTWYGAVAYCNWRSQQEGRQICYNLSTWTCDYSKKGYRLPTEAEWEYAARGGLSGNRFPWGETITHSQANYLSDNSYSYDISPTLSYHPIWNDGIEPYTSPVGSFAPNGYSLYDMAGNVWEWCNDWFSESYYNISPTNNPTGPATGGYRVIRGGGWFFNALICRVTYRYGSKTSDRDDGLGFRVVLGSI